MGEDDGTVRDGTVTISCRIVNKHVTNYEGLICESWFKMQMQAKSLSLLLFQYLGYLGYPGQ